MKKQSTGRFTIDGSDALETRLAEICDQVRRGVESIVPPSRLCGLLLGGGYGRGEGGVLRTSQGDQPYNDLEFYVFATGAAFLAERRYRQALHELGESLSPSAGLEVEFKVLTQRKLRHSPPSMFYYDLIMGHRRICGPHTLLEGCDHHRHPDLIPMHEATRLLMNRCTGLLFSLARLQREIFGAEEADFVGRNLAKAQLAFGDAVLAVLGQYHWSCRDRHERLKQLPLGPDLEWAAPLPALHAAGVAFKLHPVQTDESREQLLARHSDLCAIGRHLWLWIESRRLSRGFASTQDYVFNAADKCPETSRLRNRAVNFRVFGASTALGIAGARYPRQRLFEALCLLLWEKDAWRDPNMAARLAAVLGTKTTEFTELIDAYARLWQRFN